MSSTLTDPRQILRLGTARVTSSGFALIDVCLLLLACLKSPFLPSLDLFVVRRHPFRLLLSPILSPSPIAHARARRSMITPNGMHSLHSIHRGSWAASARKTRAWEMKGEGGEEERRTEADIEILGSEGDSSFPLHLSSSRLDDSDLRRRNPMADRQVQTMLALPLELEEEEERGQWRGSNSIFRRRDAGESSISRGREDPTVFDVLHMVRESQHGKSERLV
eukprot:749517-Hanusia_phi.AAC.4